MKKLWCVIIGKWQGADDKLYYCSWAESFDMYVNMLKYLDKHIVDIRPCETKRDAQAVAENNNEMYKMNGNYATVYKMHPCYTEIAKAT